MFLFKLFRPCLIQLKHLKIRICGFSTGGSLTRRTGFALYFTYEVKHTA